MTMLAMRRIVLGLGVGTLALATIADAQEGARMPRLKVSENRRFLVNEDGRPFFYLGDTAWELFHRLNREETARYLDDRAAKGFTVIQAVVLAELDGLHTPNAHGQTPLIDDDPARPNEEYFRHVDWVVAEANRRGLVIGMLPTWGDKWNKKWGVGPEVFTTENAGPYGEWLGKRYQDAGILWILGGDRPVENDTHKAIIANMARGLRKGDGGAHLITFHPSGGGTSADPFGSEDWLDFNMNQNGHEANFNPRYEATRKVYDREPTKPVIDGEPIYEDHPISFKAREHGHSIAADVRRPLYWDLFSGAFGHTYGHHSVWQMFDRGRNPINAPLMPWHQAIDQPGAGQMQHGRRLMESRPFLTRVPDDTIVVPADPPTAVPGAGLKRYVATRDSEGRYAMIYAPIGRPFRVRMDVIRGGLVRAWWFNPRDGASSPPDEFPNTGTRSFEPPTPGEALDWVLVLDDAAQGYPPPGAVDMGP
jgi:hypothetical protein